MSLIKLKQPKGDDLYVNPNQIALIVPAVTIGECGLLLPAGVTVGIAESARDVAHKFGFVENLSE